MFLRCFTCDARYGNEPTLYSCRKCDNPLEVGYEDAEFARAGSFENRGMTVGIAMARAAGAGAVGCASTGNTSASMAAYAARAGLAALVLLPAGKVALGKLSQAI